MSLVGFIRKQGKKSRSQQQTSPRPARTGCLTALDKHKGIGCRYHEYVATSESQARDLLYQFDVGRRIADAQVGGSDAEALWGKLNTKNPERPAATSSHRRQFRLPVGLTSKKSSRLQLRPPRRNLQLMVARYVAIKLVPYGLLL